MVTMTTILNPLQAKESAAASGSKKAQEHAVEGVQAAKVPFLTQTLSKAALITCITPAAMLAINLSLSMI